ncbi:hypothetical protein C8R44DRAFT_737470 [Mycena epipterygia]|nr:hypothetical protein C8R44DRAFT_737470 [Mycena epipterygia]
MTSVGLVALAVRRKHNDFRVSEVKGMWFSSKTEVGEVQKERKKNNELIEDIFDWLVQPARDSKSTSEASRTSTATTSSSKIDRARGTSANSCEASSVLQGIDRPLREAAPAFKGNLRRSRLRRVLFDSKLSVLLGTLVDTTAFGKFFVAQCEGSPSTLRKFARRWNSIEPGSRWAWAETMVARDAAANTAKRVEGTMSMA